MSERTEFVTVLSSNIATEKKYIWIWVSSRERAIAYAMQVLIKLAG
jgi:hypothetical protein